MLFIALSVAQIQCRGVLSGSKFVSIATRRWHESSCLLCLVSSFICQNMCCQLRHVRETSKSVNMWQLFVHCTHTHNDLDCCQVHWIHMGPQLEPKRTDRLIWANLIFFNFLFLFINTKSYVVFSKSHVIEFIVCIPVYTSITDQIAKRRSVLFVFHRKRTQFFNTTNQFIRVFRLFVKRDSSWWKQVRFQQMLQPLHQMWTISSREWLILRPVRSVRIN